MKLTVAYSPCPNDTFMFHDVAMGTLHLANAEIEVRLHDIETLNRMAMDAAFDVTKLSFPAYLRAEGQYHMLSAGAAIGYDAGPLVVSRRALRPSDLPACRFAVPGELTTAHLLLQLWSPQVREKVFVRYDRVMPMVAAGQVDAGVVIHEGRFTYERAGLRLVADLGAWWQEQTQLPIPLACIAARRSLGTQTIAAFEGVLRQAIANSLANPEATCHYVRQFAQEMDEAALKQHIHTFVNRFSLDLAEEGRAAIDKLRQMARRAGIVS
jgi:1,4-dihydroxy-6-naphthoate synthase